MTTQHNPRPRPPSTHHAGTPSAGTMAPGIGAPPSEDSWEWAHGVLAETENATGTVATDLHMLRDGAKRLALVSFDQGPDLALKQYADDRGLWTQRWLRRLAAAGFADPARLGVTRARGWSRTHKTLVTDVAPKHPWASWLVASPDARDAATSAAADWLAELQSLDVALPDRSTYRAGLELQRHCGELALAFPSHAASVQATRRLVHDRLYESERGAALVPSHGDLHPNNLHITGNQQRVVAIDVDTAGLRRPAYDVGYALAQMLIVSWMRTGSFHAGAAAGRVFWLRWVASGGRDADAVGAESVRALLQSLHFELVTYRNGRTALLDPWLRVAHSMLIIGPPETLDILATAEENAS